MLNDFIPRRYQETILGTCSLKNCLVVLPTGLGKTGIALLLAIQRLKNFPKSKILFLAPTKPLVEQHKITFLKHLKIEEDKLKIFTGEIPPLKRAALWKDCQIVFSTPQGLENDIINKNIDLKNVSLIIFDEAHRAVGDYSYVFIAKQYVNSADFPRILGLTASPGSDILGIEAVCQNLFVESVEIRSDEDQDVAPYIKKSDLNILKVELSPELKKIKTLLEKCIKSRFSQLSGLGIKRAVTKKDLLGQQARLRVMMSKGEKSMEIFKSLSVLAEVMKLQHALELVETQSLSALLIYFDKLMSDSVSSSVKAVKNIVIDPSFKEAHYLTRELLKKGVEHPKLSLLKEKIISITKKNKLGKVIVFTQFRDSASQILSTLKNSKNIRPVIFVGQAKKNGTGLSQKKQKEVLDLFRDGEYNVLIATSVAEEGLDIPQVDDVIFYEPIPSAVRTIQRRGRTGRHDKGNITILVTKNTRDEAYSNVARYKEKSMNNILYDLKRHFSVSGLNNNMNNNNNKEFQQTLKTKENKVLILVDYREKGSPVIKQLLEQGINVKLEMLNSADFILSHNCGVEFKTTQDFVNSIIDGRIIEQMKKLKQKFEKPVLIIEGEEDIYSLRNIHPNSIRGMIAAITTGYGIPIIRSKNAEDTAGILFSIANREQNKDSSFNIHFTKPGSIEEQLEFIVSSLPNIGPQLAKELLSVFGSVKNIINANIEDLSKVKGIGDKTARQLKDLIEKKYMTSKI